MDRPLDRLRDASIVADGYSEELGNELRDIADELSD